MPWRFDGLIGTGGIGSGRFFLLDGDHTLGREESRSGRFLDRRDYCKLHIVSHYVQTLLGSPFHTIAIGRVGDDEAGRRLLEEMSAAGIDIRYVATGAGEQTMYALCFLYPDGSGGNLTVNDSASAHVGPSSVLAAEPDFRRFAGRGIALALPEAPLAARRALLSLGSANGFFRAASYTTAEILELGGGLDDVDLLALNLDEAAALAGLRGRTADPELIVRAAAARIQHPEPSSFLQEGSSRRKVQSKDPQALLTVTGGTRGSWSWDGAAGTAALTHQAALPVRAVGTAGAGDAHLAGVLVGLAIGLPLAGAHQLGALTAAVAVTSPHTINDRLDRGALLRCAEECGLTLPDLTRDFLASATRKAEGTEDFDATAE